MRVLEGNVVGTGMKIGIVAARFNEFIVSKLVGGAEDALRRHEVDTENNVDIAWVPGAFEIPMTAQKMAESGCVSSEECKSTSGHRKHSRRGLDVWKQGSLSVVLYEPRPKRIRSRKLHLSPCTGI